MHNKILGWTRRLFILILSICMFVSVNHQVGFAKMEDDHESDSDIFLDYIEGIINWKKTTLDIGREDPLLNNVYLEDAGETIGDWYPIGIGRIGYPDEYESYLAVIKDVVEKRYKEEYKLSDSKATEWHRISLAILSMGGDPTEIGKDADGKSINLIRDGTYDRGKTKSLGNQGINGWIWGLITLDSLAYKVPENAHDTRESMIEEILNKQLKDGGFALSGNSSDPDMTGMAVQALAPYYNSEESYTYKQKAIEKEVTKTVREVIDESLNTLSDLQLEGGDYESWESPNAESTAQVIVALTSLGIDPMNDERFIENDRHLLDGLEKYVKDDGGFIHAENYDSENPTAVPDKSNTMASEQILYALTALYRNSEGHRTLYDFREEMKENVKEKIDTVKESIETIPDQPTESDAAKVEKMFKDYLTIPLEERSYVFNYTKLAKAMAKLGIKNTSEPIAKNRGINNDGSGTIVSLFDEEKEEVGDEFTDHDADKVAQLPDQMTTEHYIEVIKLIEKIQNTPNKQKYEHELDELQGKKDEIEAIESEIKSINQTIIDQLYPFGDISTNDQQNVDQIITRYEKLSQYDQNKIQSYEDVEKANTQINNLLRARYITIGAIIVIVLVGFFYIRRWRKRKQEKRKQKMMVDDEG